MICDKTGAASLKPFLLCAVLLAEDGASLQSVEGSIELLGFKAGDMVSFPLTTSTRINRYQKDYFTIPVAFAHAMPSHPGMTQKLKIFWLSRQLKVSRSL